MAIDSSRLKFLAEQTSLARDKLLDAIFSRTDVPQEVKELAVDFCEANNRQAEESSRLIEVVESQYSHL